MVGDLIGGFPFNLLMKRFQVRELRGAHLQSRCPHAILKCSAVQCSAWPGQGEQGFGKKIRAPLKTSPIRTIIKPLAECGAAW